MNSDPLRLPRYPEPRQPPSAPTPGLRLAGWLRRELAPSAFRRSWRPRLTAALVLAAAALLAWFGGGLAAWQQASLWGALVVVAAVLSRRSWLRLFGPVLFYDLVRSARRGRTFLLRGAYALALLVVLFLLYSTYIDPGDLFAEAYVDQQDSSQFGSRFFFTFLALQFGAVFVLTPAFTATAIAEEKEHRTLEYLLATDLDNREIVLGKLLSRLLVLLLLLAGGLPVLSFVQFLGGVDPNLVLAGFAATAVTMLSLGSLGILNSVHAARPRGAVLSTYVQAGGYLLVSSCCAPIATFGGAWNPFGWPAAGNIFVAYARVTASAAAAGGTTGSAVLSVLAEYVVFHAVATVVLAGMAALKLRAWHREARPKSEREALRLQRTPRHGNRLSLGSLRLPRVGSDPILWKELYAEHGYPLHPLARGVLQFVGGAFLFVAAAGYLCGLAASLVGGHPGDFHTDWVRTVGTIVSCMMIVAVAMRASTGLGRERDRQTLDSLLTTPLSNTAILGGKWKGAVLSVRQAWWCLGAVWLLGFLAGGLHVLSVVMLLASWWAHAAFAAGLGLWFSLHCRTTLRATVWTLVSLLVASAVPYLLCGALAPMLLEPRWLTRHRGGDDLFVLTMPGQMVYLAFGWGDWYTFDRSMEWSVGALALAWCGACVYGLAAVVLWLGVRARFGPVTGRMPHG